MQGHILVHWVAKSQIETFNTDAKASWLVEIKKSFPI